MKSENIVLEKSMSFAVRIVKLSKHLNDKKKEYTLSNQLLRSGTSIGANVHESIYAQSRKDFISKMSIALKEAFETEYWLELLHKTEFLTEMEFESIITECKEIVKVLTAIVKSSKENDY